MSLINLTSFSDIKIYIYIKNNIYVKMNFYNICNGISKDMQIKILTFLNTHT